MSSDPFHPPTATTSSPLAFLPYASAASGLLGMGLTCCCGLIGAFFAWVLPTVFLVWGVVLFASKNSSDDVRTIGKQTAVIGFVGLLAIPFCFVLSMCVTAVFLIPADLGQVIMDTIMSA